MPLTCDQQENIRSLIDNAGAGTYEEVRNELYDHMVQAVESRLATGSSFAEAQNEDLEEMGGVWGLKTIESGYVRTVEKQIWRLFKAYLPLYVKSFRWLIPLALGLTINQYTWVSIVAIFGYLLLIPPALGKWYTLNFDLKSQGPPVSLRVYIVRKRLGLFLPASGVVSSLLLGIQVQGAVSIALLIVAYAFMDYCLAFILYTRNTWLEVAGA